MKPAVAPLVGLAICAIVITYAMALTMPEHAVMFFAFCLIAVVLGRACYLLGERQGMSDAVVLHVCPTCDAAAWSGIEEDRDAAA